jgi:hypothetical protein
VCRKPAMACMAWQGMEWSTGTFLLFFVFSFRKFCR